jgi:hypothetical protein
MNVFVYNRINRIGKDVGDMRETRTLEFKETITNTFLKTVSAFSNYDGGTIVFGIDDDGKIKGLADAKQSCLDIENKINDSISPQMHIIENDVFIIVSAFLVFPFPLLMENKGAPPLPNKLQNAVIITIIGKHKPTAPSAVVPTFGILAM